MVDVVHKLTLDVHAFGVGVRQIYLYLVIFPVLVKLESFLNVL